MEDHWIGLAKNYDSAEKAVSQATAATRQSQKRCLILLGQPQPGAVDVAGVVGVFSSAVQRIVLQSESKVAKNRRQKATSAKLSSPQREPIQSELNLQRDVRLSCDGREDT